MNVNLVLLKKTGSTKTFSLPSSVTVIGRRQDCDLCVPMMVVSRRHCELNMDQGQLRVRDLGSRNGTFLNGERIEEALVNPGDIVQIGPVSFVAQIDGVPAEIEAPVGSVKAGEGETQKHAETFAGLDDVNITRDHHATEILDVVTESPVTNNNSDS